MSEASPALPSDLLESIGRLDDPDARGETHRATVDGVRFTLRRDCHGVLRRLEISWPPERSAPTKARLGELFPFDEVVPGTLAIGDVDGLGKLYLLEDRLSAMLRVHAAPDRVQLLLSCFLDRLTRRSVST